MDQAGSANEKDAVRSRRAEPDGGRRARAVGGLLLVALVAALVMPIGAVSPVAAQPARARDVIVVLRPDVAEPAAAARELGRAYGLQVKQVYRYALNGFAARVPVEALPGLERNPRVAFVDPDRPIYAADQTLPTGVDRVQADQNATAAIGGDGGAVDVDVAVIDSGVAPHDDLTVAGGVDCTGTGSFGDDNGHGTHVAGTVAAKDNNYGVVGVASGARVWAVKVIGASGQGTWSQIICGIDWVTARAATIDVANLSLSGPGVDDACADSSLHRAICTSVNAGITYVAAAGNQTTNAANTVPATYDEVITVSAFRDDDGQPGGETFATFSNYGPDIDLAAPGVSILSTTFDGGYGYKQGTSMAAPHVAGGAALYVAQHGRVGPAAVRQGLLGAREARAIQGDPDPVDEGILNVAGFDPVEPVPGPARLPIVAGFQSSNSNAAANGFDGDLATAWRTTATTPPRAATVIFDLGQQVSISTIRYRFNRLGFADQFTIAVSVDRTAWTTLANRRNAPTTGWQVLNREASGRYLRFRFGNLNRDRYLGFLSEVQVFGAAEAGAAQAAEGTIESATGGDQPAPESAGATAPATGETAAVVAGTGSQGVRCRAEPNTRARIVAVLPAGTLVVVTGPAADGWFPVNCDGEAGFVRADLLAIQEATSVAPETTAPAEPTPEVPTPLPGDLTESAAARAYPIVDAKRSRGTLPATLAYDGDPATVWASDGSAVPNRVGLTLDLGSVVPVGLVRWLPVAPEQAAGLRVQLSTNGDGWRTLAEPGPTPAGVWQAAGAGVAARYVRFLVDNDAGAAVVGGLAEIEVLPALGEVELLVPDPESSPPAADSAAPAATAEPVPSGAPAGAATAQPAPEAAPSAGG